MKIRNVTVNEAFQACDNNPRHILLDVRTAIECNQGIAKGAQCIELSALQQQLSQLNKDNHYYVMCQTGIRSASAIQQLSAKGFEHLNHMHAGYVDWQAHNLPIEIPSIKQEDIRYSRHHQLQGFGKSAQEKLTKAHVLLIGAGGLGSSCGLYLAAAGVGEITLIDDDVVELSNLQRQILHSTDSIGTLKVDSAQKQLNALNPEIETNTLAVRLNKDNAENLISQVDIVIDGSDNLETRYLVNDLCLKFKKPLIYAAVYQYESQITTFDFSKKDSPCLRCLFPESKGFEPANCTTEGVLGVVPGLAGVIQATEAIKLITGVGKVLSQKLLVIDLLDNSFRSIKYPLDNRCKNHSFQQTII